MKKLFLLFVLATFGSGLIAQTAVTPPTIVKTKFDSAFAGATDVKWSKVGVDYQAEFKLATKGMKARFDKNGGYIEKQLSIDQSALPPTAKDYILKNCSGQNVLNVYKVTKANGHVTYTASVGGKAMTFDASGNKIANTTATATKPKTK